MSGYATTQGQREKYARIYAGNKSDSPEEATRSARRLIARFAKETPSNGVYLGIGAGRGATEAGIHDSLKHLRVILADIAKRRPIYSTRRNPKVLNIEADAHALPLRDESIDVASCLMSQDFYEDRSKATREAHRVLRQGAKLVLFLHHPKMFEHALKEHADYYTTKARDTREFWEKLLEEKRVFRTAAEIREFYEKHGFAVEHLIEHSPSRLENQGNYWWEIVLSKLEKKR